MQPINGSHCPECGAAVTGGREGCQALYNELAMPGAGGLALSARRDLAFDAYCMQHPDTYCRSAKSYVAHLARLCCGLEYGGNPQVYRAIQRWLNGTVSLQKPPVLSARGSMTIAEVYGAGRPQAMERLAQVWAEGVWAAYAPQQPLARQWISLARGLK